MIVVLAVVGLVALSTWGAVVTDRRNYTARDLDAADAKRRLLEELARK